MKSIEVSAKKVEDAIADGLRTLGTTIDDVTVEILSQGGLFKKARVRLTLSADDETPAAADFSSPAHSSAQKSSEAPAPDVKSAQKAAPAPEPKTAPERERFDKKDKQKQDKETAPAAPVRSVPREERTEEPAAEKFPPKPPRKEKEHKPVPVSEETAAEAIDFLTNVIRLMEVDCTLKADNSDGLNVELVTEDSAVIGYRGETLDALQYLTRLAVNKGDEKFVRVRLDCNNYRERRQGTLASLANKMANKCVKTGRRVSLEPMDSADRRVIHAALGDNERVITKSEGHEPNRHVVILPRRDKR